MRTSPRIRVRRIQRLCFGGLALVWLCLSATNSPLAQTAKMPGLKMPSDGPGKTDKEAKPAPPAKKPEIKIGKIYVVGNDVTQDQVILNAIGLYPGQAVRYADIRTAEQNLKRLGLFDTQPDAAPTIEVLRPLEDGPFVDILVRVTEAKTTGTLSIKPCITSNGLSICLVAEERNFDLFRIPTSLSDIWDGRAFRGAGQKLNLNLIEINLVHCPLPQIAAREKLDTLRIIVEECWRNGAFDDFLEAGDALETLLEDLFRGKMKD